MLRKFFSMILTLIILSIITAFLLAEFGKYFYNITKFSRISLMHLTFFYIALVFFIQVLGCLWIVYLASNILIKRKINKIIIGLFTGLSLVLIIKIFSHFGLRTYYYEPLKNSYQILVFFVTGFLYPFVFNFFLLKLMKTNSINKV